MSLFEKIKKHYKQKTLFKVTYNYLAGDLPFYYVDIRNIFKYGFESPRYAERIWVNPKTITRALTIESVTKLTGLEHHRKASGRVVEKNWPSEASGSIISIYDLPEVKFCVDHWVKNVSWENTGAYNHMINVIKQTGSSFNGCFTKDDILNRYKNLDYAFDEVKKEKRLKPAKEVRPNNFREKGGVYVHVGPEGELFFGGGGRHRFTMSIILGLDKIPAQIGIVHKSAIPHLKKLRNKDK